MTAVVLRMTPHTQPVARNLPMPARFIWRWESPRFLSEPGWTSYYCRSFQAAAERFAPIHWLDGYDPTLPGRLTYAHLTTPTVIPDLIPSKPKASFAAGAPVCQTLSSGAELDALIAKNRAIARQFSQYLFVPPPKGRWVALVFLPLIRGPVDDAIEQDLDAIARQAEKFGVEVAKLAPGSEADKESRRHLGMSDVWAVACLDAGQLGRPRTDGSQEVVAQITAFLDGAKSQQASASRFY